MVLCKFWGSSWLCYVTMIILFVYGSGSEGSAGKNTRKRSTVAGVMVRKSGK